ncbi:hypothetical protein [Nitratiruptor tergarcus]|uniref:Uracil DNA glycosylase superfamily protein n=1 Tax=Nitratiruptor tergarcus DSM 16512 TaxID=1069081 RepID=A0A1W1WUS0_9BACT|nr:hypothetical protein [Nitratiruptor tergarcus]SMC10071.1 hypothetical protein SAMN05660197_1906 [Nitratiruptor tergarcus DSM 16512]
MQWNVGNSIFKGYNDKKGIMLCGYEWGFSKEEQEAYKNGKINPIDFQKEPSTFSNKVNLYKKYSLKHYYQYDERIIKWFGLWGHPLKRDNGEFEKTILQTNWCDSQNHAFNGNRYHKLLNCKDNFLAHVREFKPRLIIFLGAEMIKVLNNPDIKNEFEKIMGKETKPLKFIQKDFPGKRFKIGFQSFENCDIAAFPHPSGTIGLSDDYIKLFKDEMNPILVSFKKFKGLS